MRLRRTLLCTVALGVAMSTSAIGATKVSCNLLQDETGDDSWLLSSPALDIQSGDIATSKNQLVAVLRLGGAFNTSDPALQLGTEWRTSVTVAGETWSFSATRSPFPSFRSSSAVSIGDTPINHTFDATGGILTWKVKRADIAPLKKKGQVLTKPRGSVSENGQTADNALMDTATYQDLAPSCVKA